MRCASKFILMMVYREGREFKRKGVMIFEKHFELIRLRRLSTGKSFFLPPSLSFVIQCNRIKWEWLDVCILKTQSNSKSRPGPFSKKSLQIIIKRSHSTHSINNHTMIWMFLTILSLKSIHVAIFRWIIITWITECGSAAGFLQFTASTIIPMSFNI